LETYFFFNTKFFGIQFLIIQECGIKKSNQPAQQFSHFIKEHIREDGVLGRRTGRTRLAKIPDASSKSLIAFIEANIEPSSTIITDGWPSYKELSRKGYHHKVQKATVKDEDEEVLPNVHRIASLLKRWLLGTHQSYLNKNKLEYYLDEYVFRYNRRTSKSRGLLFLRIIEQGVSAKPISYENIIKEKHG